MLRQTCAVVVAATFLALAPAGALHAQQNWRVGPDPEVTIGSVEGAPELLLDRVAGVSRLPDGRYAVANGGTQEIRIFDARGRFVASSGRRGQGPGEFVQLRSVLPYGRDSLLAYDFQLRRLSVFSSSGTFARTFLMPRIKDTSWPQPVGVFGDGSILVQTGRIFMMGDSDPSHVNRDPTILFRMSATGEVLDSITAVAGWERYLRVINVNNQRGFTVHTTPFARLPAYTATGNRVFVSSADAFEIDVFDLAGRKERTIRLARPNRKVTRADIELLEKTRLAIGAAQNEAARKRAETALQEMKVPATMPAFSGFRADSQGNLWVQEYRAEGERHTRWVVLDAQGRIIANVTGPDGFTVYDIGSDYIVGVRQDELDVEHVEAYRITKRN